MKRLNTARINLYTTINVTIRLETLLKRRRRRERRKSLATVFLESHNRPQFFGRESNRARTKEGITVRRSYGTVFV